jgi:hypothetical protein
MALPLSFASAGSVSCCYALATYWSRRQPRRGVRCYASVRRDYGSSDAARAALQELDTAIGFEELVREVGNVTEASGGEGSDLWPGMVFVHRELWRAASAWAV